MSTVTTHSPLSCIGAGCDLLGCCENGVKCRADATCASFLTPEYGKYNVNDLSFVIRDFNMHAITSCLFSIYSKLHINHSFTLLFIKTRIEFTHVHRFHWRLLKYYPIYVKVEAMECKKKHLSSVICFVFVYFSIRYSI